MAPAAFFLLNTGDGGGASRHRLLTTIAYQFEGKRAYALEGVDLFRRRQRAMAARRAGPRRNGAGDRRAGGGRPTRNSRRLSGAGLHRPWRAPLDERGARSD
jgi:hypothetical protein